MFDKFFKLCEERGVTPYRVGKDIGVSTSNITQWKKGMSTPNFTSMQKIAKYFNVSLDYFVDDDPEAPEPTTDSTRWIPVLGRVAAGIPAEMVEDVVDFEEVDRALGEAFALVVRGSSMFPLLVPDDVVIVKRQDDVESGTVAVVSVNGEDATCKKIIKTEEGVILQPVNPEYAPMFFSDAEIAELPVRILGRVVESRRKF